MRGTEITSVKALIKELGGTGAAAQALDATPQKIVNWRATGKLPARLYLMHRERLAGRGLAVADSVWGFEAPTPQQEAS